MTRKVYAKLKRDYPDRIVLVSEGDDYYSHGDCAALLAQAGITVPFPMKQLDKLLPTILEISAVVIGEIYRPPRPRKR